MTTLAVAGPSMSRAATETDLPALLAMFETFVTSQAFANYTGHNPAQAEKLMRFLMENPAGAVFVTERDGVVVGMLGVTAFPHPMSAELVAQEVFWWLDPAHRGSGGWLLKRAERWARSLGARRMQMMAPAENARVAETYTRLGYDRIEIVFQKDLV
jgi:RimJ/RimL family protein N-acetyltransferase